MSKLKSLDFMISMSPRTAYTPDEENAIVESFDEKHIVIKEYGKKGDHPHLHIVIHYDKPCRSDVVRKKILKIDALHKDEKEIKVSCLKDTPEMLVAKYLSKDPNREILYNDLVDLDNLPETQEHIFGVLQGKRIVSPAESTLLIIEYCNQNDLAIPTRAHDLYKVCVRMCRDDYVVHNIIKNKKDILTNIRMYVDDPDHPNTQWANEFAEF